MVIQGQVIIDADIASFSGATLHIYVQDVSRMNTAARTVQEQTVPNISHNRGQSSKVTFSMDVNDADSGQHPRYNLRAHIDKSGNGEVEKGDLVTTQSYPVNLQQQNSNYQLVVKEV